MDETESEPTAEEIESGEYFEVGRNWYADMFHRPIAERSYYSVVIVLALINALFAITSFIEIFPIRARVPFIVYTSDIWAELPRIKSIATGTEQDKNSAVMQHLLQTYVSNRESYDLAHYEIRYRSTWAQSTPDVFDVYRQWMDASNAYGPYHLYTSEARRTVVVNSYAVGPVQGRADTLHAQIVFTAIVSSVADGQEISRSKWQADLLYKYTPFSVDQSIDRRHWWIAHVFHLTGDQPSVSDGKPKVIPMTFIVSGYQAKELLE